MVMTQIGTERLNLAAVERAMNFIMGQDSKVDASRGGHAHKQKPTYDMFYSEEGTWQEPYEPDTDYTGVL